MYLNASVPELQLPKQQSKGRDAAWAAEEGRGPGQVGAEPVTRLFLSRCGEHPGNTRPVVGGLPEPGGPRTAPPGCRMRPGSVSGEARTRLSADPNPKADAWNLLLVIY